MIRIIALTPKGHVTLKRSRLPERRKMMQAWADYLDRLKTGVEVIPLFRTA